MLQQKIMDYLATQTGNVAVVYKDLTSGEGFSICGDERFPSASIIKLVIMSTLLDEVKAGNCTLSDKIVLTPEMLTGGDGILKELEPGHSFTLKEILTLMIIVSDNMATNILIDRLGFDRINQQARQLGLQHASLGRRMMDSEAKKAGRDNFICADDAAAVLEKIFREQFVSPELDRVALDILSRQQQSGRLQLYLPEEVPVAHKCGDLDFLEHDAGIVYAPSGPYILVVFTNKTTTNKDGREIIGTVSRMAFESVGG